MHALKRIQDNEFAPPRWVEDLGDYNHLPKPIEPCSIEEFWSYMAIYNPTHIDYRQVYLNGEGNKLFNTQIFFFHHRIFAVVILSNGDTRVFRIGCQHSWVELGEETCHKRAIFHNGPGYHVYECTLCKVIKAVDSSD